MHRIALLALPVVASLSLSASHPTPERFVQIHATDPVQIEMAEWALGRFDMAGLDLPSVVINFPGRDQALCGGAPARAFPYAEPAEIKMCWTDEFMLLHELAHIWEVHNVPETRRDGFASLRGGVSAWTSTDVPWEQRGVEHAANVIAWGLLEDPYPISRTYPNDPDSMLAAYTYLTGSHPLHDGGEGIIQPDRTFHQRTNTPLESGY